MRRTSRRRNADAAKGSADIPQNITGVAQAAKETYGGAVNTQQLARNLARMAAEFQTMIYEFKLADIGEGVVEGEVVRWLVNEGDLVREDQPEIWVFDPSVGGPRRLAINAFSPRWVA